MKGVILALLAAAAPALAQTARVEHANGLASVALPHPSGMVWVNLPEKIVAGDRASGSLATEPAGATAAERQANAARLATATVEVAGARAKVSDGVVRFTAGPGPVRVRLIGAQGAAAEIALSPAEAGPAAFRLPSAGQAGHPIRIRGPFSGNLSGTTVSLGGRPVPLLAETPRECLARDPREPVGETDLDVREQRQRTRHRFRNFAVRLESPRTSLKSGETTPLTVTVEGIAGYGKPLPLTLSNLSGAVVAMEGGADQSFTIAPTDEPTYTVVRTLTGRVPGDFHIQGVLRWEEEPEYPPPTTQRRDDQIPQLVDDNRPEPKHHCAAGKLIVVIGDFKNKTIAAAIDWAGKEAAKPGAHVHVVLYSKTTGNANFDTPYVLAGGVPVRPTKKGGGTGGNADLHAQEWNDCCFFSQVILLFHGNDFSWEVFADNLSSVLGGRAVRQMTLWSCESTSQFFPKSQKGSQKAYGNIGWTLRPRACPCKCDPAMAGHKGAACPTATDSVTIFASAGFQGKASKLEIDPKAASPLKSPSGTLRQITVSADGSMTTTETSASDPPVVFDGIKVGASGKAPDAKAENYDKEKFEADAKVDPFEGSKKNFPVPEVKYSGPHACPNKEGCLPDPI